MTRVRSVNLTTARPTIVKTLLVVTFLGLGLPMNSVMAQELAVIELTQTPCQFIESENGVDRGFSSNEKSDCDTINEQSGLERLAEAKILRLKPGRYVFRVTNKTVPYPLGFWLRGDGLIGRATLPSVSGGGLTLGTSKDYVVDLEEGEYLYSCPLNPTPNYKLVVQS